MDYFYGGENRGCCYLHPKEVVVGICALCLKERLLTLASKQGRHHPLVSKHTHTMKPIIALPRVFAIGSFLHRLEPRPSIPDDDDASIASLEDSFISIKFEDNGRACWDKKGTSSEPDGGSGQGMAEECKGSRSMVVEHAKPQGMLRWRKRIGHLLQLVRWKRSSKAGACHVRWAGKVEGRKGWIRSLTRRRTTTTTTSTAD